jgi:hypothetical protein
MSTHVDGLVANKGVNKHKQIKSNILNSFLKDQSNGNLPANLVSLFVFNLNVLKTEFCRYFPNPFECDFGNLHPEQPMNAQEELLILSVNVSLKQQFKFVSLTKFWKPVPILAKNRH